MQLYTGTSGESGGDFFEGTWTYDVYECGICDASVPETWNERLSGIQDSVCQGDVERTDGSGTFLVYEV